MELALGGSVQVTSEVDPRLATPPPSAAAEEPVSAHAQLGGLCFADDDFEGARRHWEEAFRELRATGNHRGAVRVAADLAGLHVSIWGNRSVGGGWIDRGRRLLRGIGRCVEEGYLALAVLGCDQPDVERLEQAAELALSLSIEFSDPVLEVRALAESGFALVVQGSLVEGFARLDEALTAVTAGDVEDVGTAAKCFCAMLSACDRAGELARAREWTAVVEAFVTAHEKRPRILHTHCRGVYGSLLSSVGRWSDAEQALMEALSPEASQALNHRAESAARLADLRIRQGRLDEAERLLSEYEDCTACCESLARLHLARDEAHLAVAVIERGLEELVGDRVRGGPLLALLVEAHLGAQRVDAAVHVARELSAIAEEVDSPMLGVEAALAEAKVARARGDTPRAMKLLGDIHRDLADADRPMVVGLVHLERARVWSCVPDPARVVSEARAALAIFERLGAVPDADRAAALLRSAGDRGRSRRPGRHDSTLSPREGEVLDLLRQGLTNAEIANRLYISPKTAEHHVSAVLTKLGVRSRAEAVALHAEAQAPQSRRMGRQ
jgi:DNA-binding CsgD family transcriptional regulator